MPSVLTATSVSTTTPASSIARLDQERSSTAVTATSAGGTSIVSAKTEMKASSSKVSLVTPLRTVVTFTPISWVGMEMNARSVRVFFSPEGCGLPFSNKICSSSKTKSRTSRFASSSLSPLRTEGIFAPDSFCARSSALTASFRASLSFCTPLILRCPAAFLSWSFFSFW